MRFISFTLVTSHLTQAPATIFMNNLILSSKPGPSYPLHKYKRGFIMLLKKYKNNDINKCYYCDGSGYTPCNYCYSPSCFKCQGTGYEECKICGGSGRGGPRMMQVFNVVSNYKE